MNKIKENKGISIPDVMFALTILMMFVGVIGNLYYKIAYHSNFIKMNAFAVHYAVRAAEDVEKMSYEQVTDDLGTYLKSIYKMPEIFDIDVSVKKYSDEHPGKEDILKIVTIKISYESLKETREYELEMLKVKEM